jgi:predicted DNA binding protein
MAMRTAKLLLRIPGNWIGEMSVRCNASVKVLRCVPSDRAGGRSLLRIELADTLTDESLEGTLNAISPDCRVDLATLGPGKHIATVTNNGCLICNLLNEADCFLDSAVSQPDGRVAWTVIAPRSDRIGLLIARLKEAGCEVEMISLREQEEDAPLTYHQEKVVRTAYDMGYYDIPRTVTLNEVSEKLGLARSTIDVVLRRAERRLIGQHIGR